ncbi:DUF4349 domain-containing protein, partial [Leucobacter sp. M11]|uniref:DUF4349 domain-containing protein n=1 Tax=Leucobacter sp. M11 TaxID=2993565 RepID=UPI002D7E7F1A
MTVSSELGLSVDRPEEVADEVDRIAGELDGRVEVRTISAATDVSSASAQLLLRVPAPRLSEAVASISELGAVTHQSTNRQDVTEVRVDLEARQESLEGSITRLQGLMADAKNTAELIEAESALAQRQAELAGITAQLDSLTDQVELSSLWVMLDTPENAPKAAPGSPLDWLLAGVASIGAVLLWLAGAIVFLVPWVVLLALLVAVIWLIRRLRRGGKRSGDAAQTTGGAATAPGTTAASATAT